MSSALEQHEHESLNLLRQYWRTNPLRDEVNRHNGCSSVARTLAQGVQAHALSLQRLRMLLSEVDLLIVGNSVARNVYFTAKGLLELAEQDAARPWSSLDRNASTTSVASAAMRMNISHVYRTDEKALCPPRTTWRWSCSSTVGSTNLFTFWANATATLPIHVLTKARDEAANRGRQLQVIIYDVGVLDAIGWSSEDRLLAAACEHVSDLDRLLSIHDSIFWLPAPQLCAEPGSLLTTFWGLPNRSMEAINRRISLRNRQIGCALERMQYGGTSAAMPTPRMIRVLDNSLSPAVGPTDSATARECLCYDDYIHHSRLSFLAIVHIAHGIAIRLGDTDLVHLGSAAGHSKSSTISGPRWGKPGRVHDATGVCGDKPRCGKFESIG